MPPRPDPVLWSRTSLRQVLWALVFALTLPAVLIAGAGFYSGYRAEREATDLRLQETARALSLSIDRAIEKSEMALRVLALSPHIANGDFAAFHKQTLEAGLAGPSSIALIEPSGKVLLNTRVPYGSPLPDGRREGAVLKVQETRRVQLSDLQTDPINGQVLITMDMPVVIGDRVAYILSAAIDPAGFQRLISDQRIAPGWNAAVLDRSGRIVARSRSPERFIGELANPVIRDAAATFSEGNVRSETLDGVPARAYFSKSPTYNWTFVVSVPSAELTASFQRSMFWLLILAGCILMGVALAAMLSRLIAKPVDQLVAAAQALGTGREVDGTTTHVLEFDTIQKALADAATDIREQERHREEALARIAESEARLRLALNAGHLGSWEFTPSTGAFVASPQCRANFGRGPDEPLSYNDVLAAIHPDDRARQTEAVAQALKNRSDLHVEYRVIWPDHSERWIRISGRARIGPDGGLSLVGVSQDITEQRLADERRGLLLHELNHRVKNTLATVQSIAAMTRRAAEQGDEGAWDAFLGRVQGLAKTHDLLTDTQWQGAMLEDVLKNELEPYQDAMRQRIRLRGPKINLQPSAVLALGLAIHELATNATKYGSLTAPEGRVSVLWAVTSSLNAPMLILEWVESGGPPVQQPKRQGFGTRLIQRGLAQQLGGEIKLDFQPEGIRCVVTFPIKNVMVEAEEMSENVERYAS
ncbi:sensor histidine kinase [Microvirga makkahensis]|uniref:Blue-light-activated histidine kinase n=1 Tax=Microvirga makkahensis TaxID=1128670 RepID=A0A7X3MQ65_9HYPH|nr:HWE histidine kinase domain-containing protein [Microvirga makkahensis]MXQ11159.1 PAS domain-containing protein [Microvirga makkahensis]